MGGSFSAPWAVALRVSPVSSSVSSAFLVAGHWKGSSQMNNPYSWHRVKGGGRVLLCPGWPLLHPQRALDALALLLLPVMVFPGDPVTCLGGDCSGCTLLEVFTELQGWW